MIDNSEEALVRALQARGVAMDHHRGNEMELRGEVWVYVSDGTPVADDPDRACGHCGLENTKAGHDGCLGDLGEAVMNACCGHGEVEAAYVQLRTGDEDRGRDAIRRQQAIVQERYHAP
jgi:hypothetical protein